MKIFCGLFLVTALFLMPVSGRTDDTSFASVTIPQEEIKILKDNANALKDTVSETKTYLERGLSKWTWVKDTFGNHKYPKILELINTVDTYGFTKQMSAAIDTLDGFEKGIKKITDTHTDFKKVENFYNRYKPDKNNPLRSLEQMGHILEDLNTLIEKLDPSGGVLTYPIPVWDIQNNKAACDCPYGTEWNPQMGKCINQQDLAMANTDCSHLPGSTPVWSYITNQVECECQSPYSRDPSTGKCVDLMAQLEQNQRDFDERMANDQNRNQQQQFFNNMMNVIGGLSQPDHPGNSTPQNNHTQNNNSTNNPSRQENQNQGQNSPSKNPVYCGIWKVNRTCIQEDNIRNKKEFLGVTYTRNWTLYPYDGGKTIKISESRTDGSRRFVEFKKPGSTGSIYSVTHTYQNDGGRILRKNRIKLSVGKNSLTGTWTIYESYKSNGKKVGSRTYSITGVSKIRSYN